MRVLFLDIDGLLNSDRWDQAKKPINADFLESQFDPKAVALFNEVVEKIDAQLLSNLKAERKEVNTYLSFVRIVD